MIDGVSLDHRKLGQFKLPMYFKLITRKRKIIFEINYSNTYFQLLINDII